MFALGGDRFQLLGQVGQGGYGVVYRARDLRDQRDVAIKLLQDVGGSADSRFEREAALLAELRHPAIVQYVTHGKATSGQPYLVMEWLEGETLQARMARTLLSLEDTLALAMRLVAALTYAEGKGVIHRDIKPANLILVGGEIAQVKLLDFGLARRIGDGQRLTRTGLLVGTPLYMSPEQARGDHGIDTRTDVFSLASVLYEALVGQPPFEAFNDFAVLAKICFDEPLPLEELDPSLPLALGELLRAMHHKDRFKRPSYMQLADQLSRIADNVRSGHTARPSERAPKLLVPVGATTTSLRADGQQRVLCAVFVRCAEQLPDEVEDALRALSSGYHARLERLIDGSHILLLDRQLAANEQVMAAGQVALRLRELLAEAPVAICTGRAKISGPLPFGELFERGAKLLGETQPGETRADDASAVLLEARYQLSGDQGQRLLLRERCEGDAPRTVLGHRTTFVGRERELQSLSLIFEECVEEAVSRAVLVVAPAGAGKSRLRYELVERLRQERPGLRVLTARGDAMRTGTPFGLLSPALRVWAEINGSDPLAQQRDKLSKQAARLLGPERGPRVGEFLGEMIGVSYPESARLHAARRDPQLMADQVLASWLEWLEALCAQTPVLFCVEDLHWSDPGSVRFLEAALSSIAESPLMVVGFARPELRELFPQLWAERDLTEIRLPKLASRACERLLAAIAPADMDAGLRRYLIERADGNPFFLEELVRGVEQRAADHALPDTILGIIQARLDGLGEQAKLLIRAASVFGQVFQLDAVRSLLGGADSRFDLPTWVALLVEREVIFRRGAAGEQEYVFRHALIRDAAYLLLADDERALGHQLAAQWLEKQPHPEPALLADHFERAGSTGRAAFWYCAAANDALEAGSLEDVVRCGEHAAACGAEGAELGEVAAAMAEALSFSGDDARALKWAETARAVLPPGTPAWWRASQVVSITCVRHSSSNLTQVLDEMLELSQVEVRLPEQVIALCYLAGECVRTLQAPLARRVLSLVPREVPAALGERAAGCLESALATEAWGQGDLSGALTHARLSLAVFRSAGALKDVAAMLNINGYLLLELGSYEEAERAFVEEIQLGQRIGSHNDVWSGTQNLAVSYLARGKLDEAERAFSSSVEGFARLDMASFQALSMIHLASLQLRRGELGKAAELLGTALALTPLEDTTRVFGLTKQAKLALLKGDPERALLIMREPAQLVREERVLEHVATLRRVHIEALLASGRRSEAAAAIREAHSWLSARAAQIADPELRESFLSNVADHAAIVALARDGDKRASLPAP